MTMPDPGSNLHIQSVDYQCTFSQLPPDGGRVTFACLDPVHFTFNFETGTTEVSPGVSQVSWDYSWFSQATVEADISTALSEIVAAVAALAGLPIQDVDQAITVRRVWMMKPNMQGADVSSGAIAVTDFMQYPPQVDGSDSATAAESSSSRATVPGVDAVQGADSGSVAALKPSGCLPGCLWPGWVWPSPGRLPGRQFSWPRGHLGMAHTLDRCEHDGIKWFPRSVIEKYSPDQSAWAERKLAEERSWSRRPLIARFGLDRLLGREIRPSRLHGDWLRDLFPAGPEDGFARTEGNLLVAHGLENIVGYLLVGTATPPAGYNVQLTNAHTGCGTGSTGTAATVSDAALGANGTAANGSTGAWYQAMDATYPSWPGTGTANGGEIAGQSTFASGDGNYAWLEWCWFTISTGSFTGADALASTGTNPVMQNHWAGTTLGTKGSGATWVFSTTITFS